MRTPGPITARGRLLGQRGSAMVAAVAAALAFPAFGAAHEGPHDGPATELAPFTVNARGKVVTALKILHVQTGCHVWTDGKRQSDNVRILARPGARLVLTNHDVDTHRLVRMSGGMLRLGAPIAMNKSGVLVLTKAGTYRLRTQSLETPGMPEIETDGTHQLRLTIVVA